MPDSVRAFIAIPLPAVVREQMATLQERLKRYELRIRWVQPEIIHLTLRFLGDLDQRQLKDAQSAMITTLAGGPPLLLAVRGLGLFPGIRKPRVVWCGLSGETDRLTDLHGRLCGALTRCGFSVETRPFRAHLTLGRVTGAIHPTRLVAAIREQGGFASDRFPVRSVHLYQSVLRPEGPVYTSLCSAELAQKQTFV
jgi:2'-5' RNA ligase